MTPQETAVEYLMRQLIYTIDAKKAMEQSLDTDDITYFGQMAKEMEKEQIIDAFDEGQEYEYQYHINSTPKFDSETYFAETYGSEGSDETKTNKI